MMSAEFIAKALQSAVYVRKDGTASSYYYQEGSTILPNRLGITKGDVTSVQKKGRNLKPSVGQLLAQFKVSEDSPLKQNRPYVLRSQIFEKEDYPQFIGYGTCGISNTSGKVTADSDTGDLLVFYSQDVDWKVINVFFLKGMGKNYDPDALTCVFDYLSGIVQ